MDVNKLDYLTDSVAFQFEQQQVNAHTVEGIDFQTFGNFLLQTLPDTTHLKSDWSTKGLLLSDARCFYTNDHVIPHNKLPLVFNRQYERKDTNIRWDIASHIFDIGTGDEQFINIHMSGNVIDYNTLRLNAKIIGHLVSYVDSIINTVQTAELDTKIHMKVSDNHMRFAYVAENYTGKNSDSNTWISSSKRFNSMDDKINSVYSTLDKIVFTFLWNSKLKQPKQSEIELITKSFNEVLI